MELPGLVRYEPATLSVSEYAWIITDGSHVEYVHEPLPDHSFINAYVFPTSQLNTFVASAPSHKLSLVLYPRYGITHKAGFSNPTQVQLRRTALEFAKAGWKPNAQPDGMTVFWSELNTRAQQDVSCALFNDPRFLPVILLSQQAIDSSDVDGIVKELRLAQPPYFSRYHPTAATLRFLREEQMGLLFTSFNNTYNKDEVVVYLPWRM